MIRRLFGYLLAAAAAPFLATTAAAEVLPLPVVAPLATTYGRAQVLDWLSDRRFAVGRWDGTVTVFRPPATGEYGPVAEQAWTLPGGRGLQMLTALDGGTLALSAGEDRIALWRAGRRGEFHPQRTLAYAAAAGTANSGLVLDPRDRHRGPRWFLSGHANGRVLVWQQRGSRWRLQHDLDLRSPAPIAATPALGNIRDLVAWRGRYAIAGSEDGDLVGLDPASGRELFRRRYNPTAQRGINDLAVAGDWLLVANCAVGADDRNLWLFDLSGGEPVLRDAINLRLDPQRAQVFNFDVELLAVAGGLRFFASTEEGLLWRGEVREGRLVATGQARIADQGGASIDASPDAARLAAAAYQVFLFATE